MNDNWFSFKQACLNRTYDPSYSSYGSVADLPVGLTTSPTTIIHNPRRKFSLPSGVEAVVATFGTPDLGGQDNCNIDDRGQPSKPNESGSNSTKNCISKFGARNLIGNLLEWTDERAEHGVRGSLVGRPYSLASHSIAAATMFSKNDAQGTESWSFRSALRLKNNLHVNINNDKTWTFFQSDVPLEKGGASAYPVSRKLGWARSGSGNFGMGPESGRFTASVWDSPDNSSGDQGGRCAIVAPQPKPLIVRFANESDNATVKLFWATLDIEDSSVVTLASSSNKSDIESWNGLNAPANVTLSTIPVNGTTGKHVGNGGCEATYTPKSGGFASEITNNSLAENLWSGKYCTTASGLTYYKLCVVNPSLPQVTDSYLPSERTACSTVTAVDAGAGLPSFVAQSNGVKLQNDSLQANARFYWKVSGGTNVVAKLVYGVNFEEVKRWNGDEANFNGFDSNSIAAFASGEAGPGTYYGTLSGVNVLTVPAGAKLPSSGGTGGTSGCNLAEFVPPNSWVPYEPFTGTNGVSITHFACVDLSNFPIWTKVFFKVVLANTDNASNPALGQITSGFVQSEVRGTGYAPDGQTFVTREEWNSIKDGGEDYSTWNYCVGRDGAYPNVEEHFHVMPGAAGYRSEPTKSCVYDFAIDKYEAYNTGGSIVNTANGFGDGTYNSSVSNSNLSVPALNMWNNGTNAIPGSAKGQTAIDDASWFSMKKACQNRDSWWEAGLIKQRLPTGLEWVVASYGTPKTPDNAYCNNGYGGGIQNSTTTGAAFNGTGGMVKCVSAFGTYDQIGNIFEWTDEVTVGISPARNSSNKWYRGVGSMNGMTQSQAVAFPVTGFGSIPGLITSTAIQYDWISAWDYVTGFPSALGGAVNGNYYFATVNTSITPQGGDGAAGNWASLRGGSFTEQGGNGRFTLALDSSPELHNNETGGRCSKAP